MRLTIIGSGDAFGSGGRFNTCFHLAALGKSVLIDCGASTHVALRVRKIDPNTIDAIVLSHLHGDHFGGIPFFFIEYLYQKPRHRPLHIAGPLGTEEKVCELFGLMYSHGSAARRIPPTRFHLLQPEGSAIVEGINVFSFRVPHQVQEISLALKVSCDGKQILFSGDSTWTDRFLDHARGADLFLCECSFYDAGTGNHLNYLQLREYLPRLQCKQLVLTHLGEEMLARRKEIAETVAEDGMVVEI